jgi:hypothetical protein
MGLPQKSYKFKKKYSVLYMDAQNLFQKTSYMEANGMLTKTGQY